MRQPTFSLQSSGTDQPVIRLRHHRNPLRVLQSTPRIGARGEAMPMGRDVIAVRDAGKTRLEVMMPNREP